jgi:hypothetical protein
MAQGITLATDTPQDHLIDATDLATCITRIAAILDALEEVGILKNA